jgi:NhaA family Na+:H+ antiporter
VLRPIERFLHVEAASGGVLLLAAIVALLWANSPWAASYEQLWRTPLTLGIGRFVSTQSLHFWVNDGLMTLFFFIVGLEIRREIHEGELSEVKRAVLPVIAALGGMMAPAGIYLALNRAPDVRSGWGVPMATDIAFAVGTLALLGKRVPGGLRVLLLALAIIDDIGAIAVIALFYSSGVMWQGLVLVAGGVLGAILLQRLGVRRALVYVLPGVLVWLGMLRAGIHPTLTGVLFGLLTPARSWFGEQGFALAATEAVEEIQALQRPGRPADALLEPLRRLRMAQREALAPVVRLQTALHPWVAFGIMPLFALANAGVSLRGITLGDPFTQRVVLGVVLGLVVGKPLGILAASAAAVRLGLCALPRGVGWRGVFVIGSVAGIGFTMAIFVAELAFSDPARLGATKLAVLVASLASAVLGLAAGRVLLHGTPARPIAAPLRGEATDPEQR